MAAAAASKFSFLSSHRGPGGRAQHDFVGTHSYGPPRSQSLPHLQSPAGFAPTLGNGTQQLYGNLKPPFEARLTTTLHPNGTNWREPGARSRRAEEWVMPERMRPEVLPPAGRQKQRPRGKRLVGDNTNTLSHVDTLIWGIDVDGSDGVLKQSAAPLYTGRAGLNAKAERTPIYGHLPPNCARTFGPEGATDFESVSYARNKVERPLVD